MEFAWSSGFSLVLQSRVQEFKEQAKACELHANFHAELHALIDVLKTLLPRPINKYPISYRS